MAFITPSQGNLSTSHLNRPKFALWKAKVALWLNLLLTSRRIKKFNFIGAVLKMTSNLHITCPFCLQTTCPSWIPHQLCFTFTHSRNLFSAMLYFQKTTVKLKSSLKIRWFNDHENSLSYSWNILYLSFHCDWVVHDRLRLCWPSP